MKLALALSTVTFLLIGVAACDSTSSTTFTTRPSSTATDGPTRPTRPPSSGSSSSSSSGFDPVPPPDEQQCPQSFLLTKSDLDKEIGWKAGGPAQGSCSEADLKLIAANFDDVGIKSYFDLVTGVSETCAACVVSKDTDAIWNPIVGTAENDGETGFVNYGACFGAIEGAACGKAIQYESFCTNMACNDCAFTDKEREACVSKSTQTGQMCASFAGERVKACPSWTLNVKSCGDIQVAIKTLCGTP